MLSGYKLKHIESNTVIQSWGGVYGTTIDVPSVIVLPDLSIHVCAPAVDTDYHGYMLEEWYVDPPPPPPPVIPDISDRQFFQQANVAGFITQAEALAAVQTGTIPAALQVILDTIPDENQKFGATMVLAGATVFERNHPLTISIGTAMGMNAEQINAFFTSAASL